MSPRYVARATGRLGMSEQLGRLGKKIQGGIYLLEVCVELLGGQGRFRGEVQAGERNLGVIAVYRLHGYTWVVLKTRFRQYLKPEE